MRSDDLDALGLFAVVIAIVFVGQLCDLIGESHFIFTSIFVTALLGILTMCAWMDYQYLVRTGKA